LISIGSIAWLLLGVALLVAGASALFREAKRSPRVAADPAQGRAFAWINAIQWTAVSIVAFSFPKLHMDAHVMSAITAIVGLHMFPLARLFRYRLHYGTGAALTAWAGASALLLPLDQMQALTALGTGILLWLSAAVTLTVALQAARRSEASQRGDSLIA